jgi:uncharacterized protein
VPQLRRQLRAPPDPTAGQAADVTGLDRACGPRFLSLSNHGFARPAQPGALRAYDDRMYAVQLTFSDDPARLDHRPAHRERLAALAAEGLLLAAGPWSDESGALLVFLVEGRDQMDAIIAADPYYSTPGVTVAGVHEWSTVTRHPALADL